MVQPKYSPEEALQRIKLMMEYDSSKTLNENKKVIFEQSFSDVLKQGTTGAAVGAVAAGVGTFGIGAIPGAIGGAIFGIARALLSGDASRGKVKELIQSCSSKKELGKKTLSDDELDSITDSLNDAIRGLGTDEDAIKASLIKVPTVPDLCAVVDNYNQYHGDLITDLDDDLEGDNEWRDYVFLPLRKAIRASKDATDKDDGKKQDGGGGVQPRYRDCGEGPFTRGCRTTPEGPIGQVQACLKLVQDGKFWDKTQAALVSKEYPNGFTKEDVKTICGNQTKPEEVPSLPQDDEVLDVNSM